MSYFPGTTCGSLIATSCQRMAYVPLYSAFVLEISILPASWLTWSSHQKKSAYPYPKTTFEKSPWGTDTTINGTSPSREYARWSDIVDYLGLIKLSKMAPFALPQALSTVVGNDVCISSMINTPGGILTNFPLIFPWGNGRWFRINPWPCRNFSYLWTSLIFVVLGVHSWKQCDLLPLPLRFSAPQIHLLIDLWSPLIHWWTFYILFLYHCQ